MPGEGATPRPLSERGGGFLLRDQMAAMIPNVCLMVRRTLGWWGSDSSGLREGGLDEKAPSSGGRWQGLTVLGWGASGVGCSWWGDGGSSGVSHLALVGSWFWWEA